MIKKAVYAGTFDPFTLGHLNIVERSAKLFDELIVGVATSERKTPLFPIAKRCEMAAHALAHLPNVRVLELTGLTVEFAQQQGASCLVRGIRSVTDYDYESSVAEVNWQLSQGAMETIFVPTHAEFACVSSSVVRELILIQAFDALERFLPKAVLLEVLNRGS